MVVKKKVGVKNTSKKLKKKWVKKSLGKKNHHKSLKKKWEYK